jgi:hypothetical protein
MKHFNVPAIDGIPGIMPGTIKVPSPLEFDDEEYAPAPSADETYAKKMAKIPRCRRQNSTGLKQRMMPHDQD